MFQNALEGRFLIQLRRGVAKSGGVFIAELGIYCFHLKLNQI